MTKDCSIRIRGHESAGILEAKGRYHEKDSRSYVFFELATEDGEEKCSLKYDADSLEYSRSGALKARVRLKQGEITDNLYETPYGSFQTRMKAQKILILEDRDKIVLKADYIMSLNGEGEEECSICFEISAAED